MLLFLSKDPPEKEPSKKGGEARVIAPQKINGEET